MRGWPPLWFYGISKLTDGPRSRSQRLPQAQNVIGAGFSHAAAGAMAGFMGFQNWRMAPIPKASQAQNVVGAGFSHAAAGPLPRSPRSQTLSHAQNVVGAGFSHAAAGPLSGYMGFQNWRMAPCSISKVPQTQNVVGAGFSHAAAGALAGFMGFLNWCAAGPLSGFMGFQNWRMAPGPDLKGFPRPKMSSELALAMLRLAAMAGFMGFQNWRMAPCPDLKGFPRPKMLLELALAMLRLGPWLVLWGFKTDGWPRSQRLPQPKMSLELAAGPLSGFMGFQNWRMAPGPDLKGFPKHKKSLELALAMLRLAPNWRAAGPLSGFMGFQNWRMAPCPDLKGFPKGFPRLPKMSLELALAMLRLAPWFYGIPQPKMLGAGFSHAAAGFMGFQNWDGRSRSHGWFYGIWFYGISKLTDGPLVPISKASPGPKCLLELALAMLRLGPDARLAGFMGFQNWRMAPIPKASPSPKCRWSWRHGWPPLWLYGISKLTDGPRSRSQRLPQAQKVVGAGFSHAAAGA